MKDTAFGKSFTEMVDLTMVESDRNDEYTSFINTYVQLEFFGITEERTGKKNKLKKNSHLDLNKDAVHAFFASKADYFVTDDIGVQTKAFIVYKLFNIQTKVLSVQDFIARSMLLLKNEDTIASFYGGLSFSLKKGFMINQSLLDQRQLIKLLYPVFNYYNRMQINQNERGQSIQLFKSYEISYGIMFAEIALLISKCERVFGRAIDLKDEEKLSEFKEYEDGEFIRTWKHNGLDITLSWEKNTLGQSIIVLTMWF
ncbi:hypothetical protein [Pedobacter sp. MC2016-24]|uniref:hypothetical protein n=1 Tax=Pedobacter sp. MC2016-24 TaxID=2780090 RepID=UPI001882FF24|nr:hypothetical protein [Pedobacter sp. MC2016-24]MBE9599929.1 hypothetical protein [Pedobacter sp. MC2016-24]